MPAPIALTFDDGPDPVSTQRVLAALADCSAPATFFMVGERIRAHPAVAAAVIDAGHEVQLHCDRHVRHTELSEREIEADTSAALLTLAELGVHPSLWRTPWGISTASSKRVAERHGLRLVRWTIDTHDWRGDAVTVMLLGALRALFGDDVVLMHDALGPGARREDCESTVALIGGLVAGARAAGLEPCPLSALPRTGGGAEYAASARPTEVAVRV